VWNAIVLNETNTHNPATTLIRGDCMEANNIRVIANSVFISCIAALGSLHASNANGQSSQAAAYPNKPIRVVVPFPPGGGTDVIAREVANRISTNTGWNLIIENKPGAGGNLGIDALAKSPPDGYAIALGQTSNLAISVTLYGKLSYDPRELVPIAAVATSPLLFAVAADSPFKSLAELVAASKAKPDSINFASPGNGTVAHLASEMFQKIAGIRFTHVPYKGQAAAVSDLIGGQVQLYASSVPTVLPHLKSGKLRPLAVTSLKPVDDIPKVPTIAASGYNGFEAATWFGFIAPAGTPKDIVQKLNAEINKALQDKATQKKISDQGADIMGGSPEEFGRLIRSEIDRWAVVVKDSGAKVD
jgi:tripartite-type tricarboxylate transporter receptor subunit TctC